VRDSNARELHGGVTAIDDKLGACHERRFFGGEKQYDPSDLLPIIGVLMTPDGQS
jgi:hypothetical protein